jgi:hypothetical protein
MEEQLIWTHEYSLKYEKVKHAQETGTSSTNCSYYYEYTNYKITKLKYRYDNWSRERKSSTSVRARGGADEARRRARRRRAEERRVQRERAARRRRANERCVGQGTREGWP